MVMYDRTTRSCVFSSCTTAPGRTFPRASVTTPVTERVLYCPRHEDPTSKTAKNALRTTTPDQQSGFRKKSPGRRHDERRVVTRTTPGFGSTVIRISATISIQENAHDHSGSRRHTCETLLRE